MKRSERHKIKRDDFSTFMVSFLKKIKPYWRELAISSALILIVIIGWFSYRAYRESKIENANFYLGEIIYFGKDIRLTSSPTPFPQMGSLLRAEKMMDQRKYKEALNILEKTPHKGRLKDFLYFMEGNVFYEQGKCQEAIDKWKNINEEDEDFPYDAVLAYMGRCYINLGKMKEARAVYNQILNLYRNSPYFAEAKFKGRQ